MKKHFWWLIVLCVLVVLIVGITRTRDANDSFRRISGVEYHTPGTIHLTDAFSTENLDDSSSVVFSGNDELTLGGIGENGDGTFGIVFSGWKNYSKSENRETSGVIVVSRFRISEPFRSQLLELLTETSRVK